MSKKYHLLIDGDYVIYAAGFAGQKKTYLGLTDGYACGPCNNLTELAQEVLDRVDAKPKDLHEHGTQVYEHIAVDPLDHVLHSAKNMIQTQIDETLDRIKCDPDDLMISVFVDGDGNFRSRLASIRPYKGQRSAAAKPVLYNDIRQYLIECWAATVVYDQESDDAMAIMATKRRAEGITPIICGVDKDMLQVPAIHKNPNKGWRKVTEAQGRGFLYRQCLTGDPVDNIPGCYKCGPAKAASIILDDMTEKEMWLAVTAAYAESVEKYGEDIYGGLNYYDAAIENMRLVYLRREPHELWEPPCSRP